MGDRSHNNRALKSAFNNVLDETTGRSRRDYGTDLWVGFVKLASIDGSRSAAVVSRVPTSSTPPGTPSSLAAALASLSSLDMRAEKGSIRRPAVVTFTPRACR